MSLILHAHPLSSYCWKAMIALGEAGLPYELAMIDLADAAAAARFRTISPFGKMPLLEDREQGVTTPEATIVIEHLARNYPGAASLVPATPAAAHEVRLWDRYFDLYVHSHVQRIVFDRLRPDGARDRFGTDQTRADLKAAYAFIEARMAGREWVAGAFSMADCAAAPALYYAEKVEPFRAGHPNLAAYLDRLSARPSFARVLVGAQPYAHMFPQEP